MTINWQAPELRGMHAISRNWAGSSDSLVWGWRQVPVSHGGIWYAPYPFYENRPAVVLIENQRLNGLESITPGKMIINPELDEKLISGEIV